MPLFHVEMFKRTKKGDVMFRLSVFNISIVAKS